MDDIQFRKILEHFGLSWKGYRKVRQGIKKRLARHMQELRCRSLEEYLAILGKDPEERRRADEHLAVSISRFFRDQGLWRAMATEVIPQLMEECSSLVRVWSAGCACGEEVYSFKILWDAAIRQREDGPRLEIWATDMNPEVLRRAQSGIYPASSLKNVAMGIRDDYFLPLAEGKWMIASCLKEKVHWNQGDLLRDDPPRKDFHLIFLRNSVLTYCGNVLQQRVMEKVTQVLLPGGFFIIGSHEKLPGAWSALRPLAGHPAIFQKEPQGPSHAP